MAFYEHVVIARQDISPQQAEALNDTLKMNNLPMLVMDTTFIDHNVEDQIELGDEE